MKQIPKSYRKHVVITGTGRAGTTFLVQLLTYLGLDTGFNLESMKLDETARAGLEFNIRNENAPYIVKNPSFCEYVNEILEREDIEIEHVFVPMRDITAVAESRWKVVKEARTKMDIIRKLFKKSTKIVGGLLYTNRKKNQSKVLIESIYNLFFALSKTQIPVTILNYPQLINESKYLYEKLSPILKDITYEKFFEAYKKIVRKDLVHKLSNNDV